MKILVVSDSHLFGDDLQRITSKYKNKVDLMIHCGDSSLDINNPLICQYDIVVKGNHDDADFPRYQIYDDICVTHGHYYNVYAGYHDLIQLCKSQHCQLCLHGHTHVPTYQVHHDIHFLNPGSLMMNRGSYGYGTYVILEYDKKNLDVHFYHHHTDCQVPCEILKEGIEWLEEFKKLI